MCRLRYAINKNLESSSRYRLYDIAAHKISRMYITVVLAMHVPRRRAKYVSLPFVQIYSGVVPSNDWNPIDSAEKQLL